MLVMLLILSTYMLIVGDVVNFVYMLVMLLILSTYMLIVGDVVNFVYMLVMLLMVLILSTLLILLMFLC